MPASRGKRPVTTMLIAQFDHAIAALRHPIDCLGLGNLTFLIAQDPVARMQISHCDRAIFLRRYVLFSTKPTLMGFLYGVVYAYFSTVARAWIFPNAPVTVRPKAWLAR